MEYLTITTRSIENFPITYSDVTHDMRPVYTGKGIVHAFKLSEKRASRCTHVEVHHLDGSQAFRARIVAVDPCSNNEDKGRYSVFYADAKRIAPNPWHGKNPVRYVNAVPHCNETDA